MRSRKWIQVSATLYSACRVTRWTDMLHPTHITANDAPGKTSLYQRTYQVPVQPRAIIRFPTRRRRSPTPTPTSPRPQRPGIHNAHQPQQPPRPLPPLPATHLPNPASSPGIPIQATRFHGHRGGRRHAQSPDARELEFQALARHVRLVRSERRQHDATPCH